MAAALIPLLTSVLPSVLDKIIPWAKGRFGEDNVVGVATWQRFGMKSSFADVCRVYDVPLPDVIRVREMIPASAPWCGDSR